MKYFLILVLCLISLVSNTQENPWLNNQTNPWGNDTTKNIPWNEESANVRLNPWLSNTDLISGNTLNSAQLIFQMSAKEYGLANYKDPIKVVSKALWVGVPVIGFLAIPVASLSVVITNTTSTKRIRLREQAVVDEYFNLHPEIESAQKQNVEASLRAGMKKKRYYNLAKGIGIGLAGQIAFWVSLEFF